MRVPRRREPASRAARVARRTRCSPGALLRDGRRLAALLGVLGAAIGCGEAPRPSVDLLAARTGSALEVPVRIAAAGMLVLEWELDPRGRLSELRKARIARRDPTLEVWVQQLDGHSQRMLSVPIELDSATQTATAEIEGSAGKPVLLRCVARGLNGSLLRWRRAELFDRPDAVARSEVVTGRPGQAAPDVVVYVADGLRPDRLGFVGGQVPTPYFDRVAREGSVFRRAAAASPESTASVATLLSGLYASAHRAGRDGEELSEGVFTLAERFRLRGYQTIAIGVSGELTTGLNLDQGFEHFETLPPLGERAPAAFGEAVLQKLTELRGAERPLFLYVHSDEQKLASEPPLWLLDEQRLDVVSPPPATESPARRLDSNLRAAIEQRYRAAVAYADHSFGAFWGPFAATRNDGRTVLLLTSDHGQALGERGRFGHGFSLFEEEIGIPFVLWAPERVPPAWTFDEPVSLVDVLPTLLALAGFPEIATAAYPLQGVDLSRAWSNPHDLGGRLVVAELFGRHGAQRAMSSRRWKLYRSGDAADRLFDLRRDPAERRDRAAREQARLQHLAGTLDRWLATQRRAPS